MSTAHPAPPIAKTPSGGRKRRHCALKCSTVVSLDENLALLAADVSQRHKLAMVDTIVYAVALAKNCNLITSGRDLDALPQVTFIRKAKKGREK